MKIASTSIIKIRKGIGNGTRIHVSDMSKDTVTTNDLNDHFGQFGNITEIYIPPSQRSKRKVNKYAFLNFDEAKAAEAAVNAPIHTVNGRNLTASFAQPIDPEKSAQRERKRMKKLKKEEKWRIKLAERKEKGKRGE
jgi:RNA recognition motif-containing protein